MVTAQQIAEGLNARRYGDSWRCPCPVCGEANETKFKISEGNKGPLIHCFAGCDFRALAAALKERGLWSDEGYERPPGPPDHKIRWAKTFLALYNEARDRGESISESDRADYRKARAILREAKEVGRA